jgi:Tfp pilus assembly protein PilF
MLVDSGRPGAAETVLRKAVEIGNAATPQTPELKRRSAEYHLQLARALRDEGISIAAFMKEFAAAIDSDPAYVNTYLEVALTLQNAHDEGSAEKWLKDALQVAPTSTAAKVQLAKLYMNPSDPSQKNMDAAIGLLAQAVSETQSQDVSLLVGLASALASVKRYDEALVQMDVALSAARAGSLPAWQIELLASMRQQYFLALVPLAAGGEPRFGVDGRVVHDPGDDPLPPPWQPSVFVLAKYPIDLSQPPGPGNALNPALYTGAALQRPASGEFNGMPILDIMK